MQRKKARNSSKLLTRNFLLITVAMMLTRTVLHMTSAVFPVYITSELMMSKTIAGILSSANAIAAILTRPIVGRFADKGREKTLFIAGLASFMLSIFGYGIFSVFPLLFAARLFYGLGQSSFGTSGSTIATQMIPESRMREGVGYFGLSASMAQAIGPPIAIAVVTLVGYRMHFMSSTILIVLSFIAFLLIRRPDSSALPVENDNQVSENQDNSNGIWFDRIIERSTRLHSLVIFITDISLVTISTFLIIRAKEIGIVNIGLFFTTQAIALTFMRLFGARLTGGKLERPALIFSFIGLFLVLFFLFFAVRLWQFILIAAVHGLCSGNYNMTMQTTMILSSPPQKRGMANASYFLSLEVGNAVAGPLWGFLSDMLGTRSIYLFAAWIPLVALFIFLKYISPRFHNAKSPG